MRVIVLNVRVPTQSKYEDSKGSFYEELKRAFDQFRKYYIHILLGDFSAKLEREDILKPIIANKTSNYCGVRVVNFAISEYLIAKSTVFPRSKIPKCTWISPDEKTTYNHVSFVFFTLFQSSVRAITSMRMRWISAHGEINRHGWEDNIK